MTVPVKELKCVTDVSHFYITVIITVTLSSFLMLDLRDKQCSVWGNNGLVRHS